MWQHSIGRNAIPVVGYEVEWTGTSNDRSRFNNQSADITELTSNSNYIIQVSAMGIRDDMPTFSTLSTPLMASTRK